MAKQLVEMLEGEFNPTDYKDEYRERVMEFIEKKAKGKKPRLHAVKAKRKTTSLDSVLAEEFAVAEKTETGGVRKCRADEASKRRAQRRERRTGRTASVLVGNAYVWTGQRAGQSCFRRTEQPRAVADAES